MSDPNRQVCRRCGWDSAAPDVEVSPFCVFQGHLLRVRKDLELTDATPRTEYGPLETAERARRGP